MELLQRRKLMFIIFLTVFLVEPNFAKLKTTKRQTPKGPSPGPTSGQPNTPVNPRGRIPITPPPVLPQFPVVSVDAGAENEGPVEEFDGNQEPVTCPQLEEQCFKTCCHMHSAYSWCPEGMITKRWGSCKLLGKYEICCTPPVPNPSKKIES